MKKIISLLLSTTIFTATYAQPHKGFDGPDMHHRPVYAPPHSTFHNHKLNRYQKQKAIERINREYRFRVRAIEHNRYMTKRQKRLAIRDAKNERDYKLKSIRNNSFVYVNTYGKAHRK
jgi:hypothetical protein